MQPKCKPLARDEVANAIFLVAEQFSAAVNALAKADNAFADIESSCNIRDALGPPEMVCEAFSAELYLKCLHAIAGNIPPPKSHDLFQLFSGLSSSTRSQIKQFYERSSATDKGALKKAQILGLSRNPTMEENIKEAAQAFEHSRYPWEDDYRFQNFDLTNFRNSLQQTILKKRPTFQRILKRMTMVGRVFKPCGPNCRGILGNCQNISK